MTDRLKVLLDSPTALREVTETQAAVLLAELEEHQAAVTALRAALFIKIATPKPQLEDRLVSIAEAADRMAVSESWLYQRANQLPFIRKLPGGALRVSLKGLEKWLMS